MKTRFLMNSRKEKAMKAFGMGGYKRGGHVTEISIVLGMPKGLKNSGMGHEHKMPKMPMRMRKADGGPVPMENPEISQTIDDANQILRSEMGLRKGGIPRKANGGELISKYGTYGNPLSDIRGLRKGGSPNCSHKHNNKYMLRKALGGLVDFTTRPDPEIQQIVKTLKPIGLKKGGTLTNKLFKHNIRKSDYGDVRKYINKSEGGEVGLTKMANRDFNLGKRAIGLKMGGDTRMAVGGAGKIRLHQMSKSGKPIKPSSRKY